jgi:hypothetical protein
MIPRDDVQGPAGAIYAVTNLHAKKIATIDDGTAGPRGVADQFAKQAQAPGATILRYTIRSGGKDFHPVLGNRHLLSAALDIGAMGLIVQFAKYYPAGQRGAAFGFAHDDYKVGDVFEKMKSANEELLLAALVETVSGIEKADRIAAVEGIDVSFRWPVMVVVIPFEAEAQAREAV